eukprot:scaffold1208_cov113-Isochrysis_galbana.AAC.9
MRTRGNSSRCSADTAAVGIVCAPQRQLVIMDKCEPRRRGRWECSRGAVMADAKAICKKVVSLKQ